MKPLSIILLVIIIITASILFSGLIWMVLLNILAGIFNEPRLAIGYWPSVIFCLIFSAIFNAVKVNKN